MKKMTNESAMLRQFPTVKGLRLEEEPRPLEHSLGDEVRNLRRAKGFTIRDLAEATGRSIGYISRIENGKLTPSLPVLESVARALQVDTSWFLPSTSSPDSKENGLIVRSQNRRRLSVQYKRDTESLGMAEYMLSASLSGNLLMGLLELNPGGTDSIEKEAFGYDFAAVVLAGSIQLVFKNDVFTLYEGDSTSFDARHPHLFRNSSDSPASMIWAITPITLAY